MVSLLWLLLLGLGAAGAGVVFGRLVERRRAETRSASTRRWLDSIRAAAVSDGNELRQAATLAAREEAELAGAAFDALAQVREGELSAREGPLDTKRKNNERLTSEVAERRARMDVHRAAQRVREEEQRRRSAEIASHESERLLALERRAGLSRAAQRTSIVETEIEEARVASVQLLRAIDQSGSDPEQVRRAKRVMGIAVGRFSGHYLTERLLSIAPLPAGLSLEQLAGADEANLRAIEAVANVKLTPTEKSLISSRSNPKSSSSECGGFMP